MKWRVILESDPETGDWAIWCPELPGCTSAGETEEEALENIKEAIQLYLQPDLIKLSPGAIAREITV
ncbi:type II toxin-antitoxin system HicB family antitoxin [Dolichospermum sp. LEGE 00240]|jgi:predicted RNase H-like HicB family nuclease|uniref:type II toxin-antitoxin system HicB family antitoxin n=1 Tax=Dolichospermum sp. LEGE 00240 TaxID=1828603 RepID=UPI001882E40E|nr:type II toxin-antitoxin system HicB family antitoxin [Dolichospermum sp. LEGE 00240]MDM3845580.1 type II toxin-antitoxin system HicB family antitoxin [Aphanizomenon gracile PMC638.10]MDM3852187.1 type II toxin-antitoxin system HicB family antitoxin [Aphanizomenon gracile PMC627.10]MDM3857332.1 type II toxin-antitoxin system HicB family antitoxin [Aphanizomenon gracile PMC649.10]MDM3858857.1 type II toxin-antitoxin system HicB family antitoxin [Aphanizomenon gracile PMC644.10]MBE9251445.1 ty